MNTIEEFLYEAKSILGGHAVLTGEDDLQPFSHDEAATSAFNQLPAAVVKPGTEEEAAQIVMLCARLNLPITARGGGTGLSAGCVPAPNGIVLSLERLNKVIEIDKANMTITVEAGVPLRSIYESVEEAGLFFFSPSR